LLTFGDFNQVDPFHLEAYNIKAVNYNRDVEIFPVVKKIMQRIMDSRLVYKSPTDMGVNKAGFAIINDDLVQQAAKQELIRRFLRYSWISPNQLMCININIAAF
ncbi:unnamed protein product, partial [marine sediment metagenome]